MNFFEAQAKAKRHTFIYMVLFVLAVAGLIVLTNVIILIGLRALETPNYTDALYTFMQASTPQMWLISSGIVLLIVGSGSLYMMGQLSKGGSFVAESLGGRKIHSNTDDSKERQLLNVVQEMSIASGIPVPSVYVLYDKSINAFAAGQTTDDAVIGVTQGLLDFLNREELQGVIAHEFSHIFNGDMKMNMRLTGTLHGILLVGLIGEGIIRNLWRGSRSGLSSSGRSNKKKGGNAMVIIIAVAIAFYIIGLLGKLIGGWIKASISRKREYLADATAVQYTRYPQGIAGALKKIGGLAFGSEIHSTNASTFSHLYFAKGVNDFVSDMFATHPPLKKRILAIDSRWDGKYPLVTRVNKDKSRGSSQHTQEKKEQLAAVMTSATIGAKMASIGKTEDIHIDYAQAVSRGFSDGVKDKLNDPLGVQTLMLALLTHSDKELQGQQINILPQQMRLEFKQSLKLIKEIKREHYLELVQLAIPTLKSSSKNQYQAFKSYLLHFVEIDKKVSLFEWSLQHIILRPLDLFFGFKNEVKMIHSTIGEVRDETQVLFSMLAQAQYKNETEAKKAFERVKKKVNLPIFTYIPKKEIDFNQFSMAIITLQTAKLPIKKRIMEGALAMMMADEHLSIVEYEMIHAIAEILQIPLPPLRV